MSQRSLRGGREVSSSLWIKISGKLMRHSYCFSLSTFSGTEVLRRVLHFTCTIHQKASVTSWCLFFLIYIFILFLFLFIFYFVFSSFFSPFFLFFFFFLSQQAIQAIDICTLFSFFLSLFFLPVLPVPDFLYLIDLKRCLEPQLNKIHKFSSISDLRLS